MFQYRFFSWQLAKYVGRDVVVSFLIGTTVFLFIMLMFQAVRLAEFVIIHQVPPKEVLRLSVYLGVSFIPIAVPVAFLFAVLLGISRANAEGEIIALQTSGTGLLQVFFQVFLFSIPITAFCVYTSLVTVPAGNRAFELLITRLGSERIISALKPGVFIDFYGIQLFADQVIALKNEMKRVFIYDDRDESFPVAVTAQAGLLRNLPEKGLVSLRLTSGTIHIERPKATDAQQKINFGIYDINLPIGPRGGDAWRDYSPPSYTITQLRTRIGETVQDLPQHRRLLTEYHRRFSMAFSCMVFAALGFFIGIQSQRGIRITAILLCLLVGVVYWLSFLSANALAMTGMLPAWIGVWTPNFFFLFVAYLCYRRYSRV